jgi:hypothetical protein
VARVSSLRFREPEAGETTKTLRRGLQRTLQVSGHVRSSGRLRLLSSDFRVRIYC